MKLFTSPGCITVGVRPIVPDVLPSPELPLLPMENCHRPGGDITVHITKAGRSILTARRAVPRARRTSHRPATPVTVSSAKHFK
jgi:hypothetical protein